MTNLISREVDTNALVLIYHQQEFKKVTSSDEGIILYVLSLFTYFLDYFQYFIKHPLFFFQHLMSSFKVLIMVY